MVPLCSVYDTVVETGACKPNPDSLDVALYTEPDDTDFVATYVANLFNETNYSSRTPSLVCMDWPAALFLHVNLSFSRWYERSIIVESFIVCGMG